MTEHAKAVVRAVEPVVDRLERWYTPLETFGSQRLQQEFPLVRDMLKGIKTGPGMVVALAVAVAGAGAAAWAGGSRAKAKEQAEYPGKQPATAGATPPRAETPLDVAKWYGEDKPNPAANQRDQTPSAGVTV